MTWKGESRRHSLARRGVKTAKGLTIEGKRLFAPLTSVDWSKVDEKDVYEAYDTIMRKWDLYGDGNIAWYGGEPVMEFDLEYLDEFEREKLYEFLMNVASNEQLHFEAHPPEVIWLSRLTPEEQENRNALKGGDLWKATGKSRKIAYGHKDVDIVQDDFRFEKGKIKVGKFHWNVDGKDVIVSKDTKYGIETLDRFTYKNYDTAMESAYKMALIQSRA